MNEIQIGVDIENYFLQEIQALGWKQFLHKFCYILATMKLGYNFAEVACHLFNGWVQQPQVCKQFLKIIERGFTIEESRIFNNPIDISSWPWAYFVIVVKGAYNLKNILVLNGWYKLDIGLLLAKWRE